MFSAGRDNMKLIDISFYSESSVEPLRVSIAPDICTKECPEVC